MNKIQDSQRIQWQVKSFLSATWFQGLSSELTRMLASVAVSCVNPGALELGTQTKTKLCLLNSDKWWLYKHKQWCPHSGFLLFLSYPIYCYFSKTLPVNSLTNCNHYNVNKFLQSYHTKLLTLTLIPSLLALQLPRT